LNKPFFYHSCYLISLIDSILLTFDAQKGRHLSNKTWGRLEKYSIMNISNFPLPPEIPPFCNNGEKPVLKKSLITHG